MKKQFFYVGLQARAQDHWISNCRSASEIKLVFATLKYVIACCSKTGRFNILTMMYDVIEGVQLKC